MSDPEVPAYSISYRLRRTTTEFAFVSVPVTADLLNKQPDGTGRLDGNRVVQRAIEMGQAPGVEWTLEERQIQPHPVQMPPPWVKRDEP
jgi:hypothetical protein